MTIVNTRPEFYWLTNFLETLISNALWHPMTSATTAHQYRELLDSYAKATSDIPEFVDWQGHDFSMRGQTSVESSISSAAGHLLSFTGTDTIPGIEFLEKYYGADGEKELIGGSVAATEHSVMCFGGKETEKETYLRLITEVYPSGIVSIVSDTWDYWKVVTETVRELKDIIMKRDGKVVIRPDSGDPAKILCGDPDATPDSPQHKGTIQVLWDIFGGSTNSKGYKQLHPSIGCIYGDSITLERAKDICEQLKQKGFASTNVVFGIGSYTYQHVTRDTYGFAMKATWGVVNGQPIEVFKAPATDVGVKHSAKGLLKVNTDLTLSQGVTEAEEKEGMLQTIFEDGRLHNETTLSEIRKRLRS
jgi:nicotinamide phosphoribosyltransferase